MSDDNKRIIDYDAFNELPPNSWLVVDSEGQGTGKIAPIKIGATYEIQDGAHSFTLVGSNGYSHTVDIPYDSVQMSYSDYDALTELEKMDGTNRFVPDCPTTELEPEIWQRVGRDPLTTDEKTVSKAINELDSRSKAVNGDAFSELVEYSKGDYCIHDNAMYIYIADTPSTGSWDALKWELTDIQTEFTSIKSNLTNLESDLTDKASRTWIYVGYGSTVTIPEDYTEALVYMFGRNTSGGNRRIGAQLTFLPQLWGEQVSNKIEFLLAGYHISNTDHGYGSLAVTNNGKSFSIQSWTYGNGNAGDTYIMVYYRK